MKLPPIFLPDEEHSLLQILRACAHEQSSLAAYAEAETRKINALISRIDEYGANCLNPLQAAEVRRNTTAAAQVAHDLHRMMRSNLQVVLDKLQMEPLYNLTSLPAGYCCRIAAHGAGRVNNSQDCHCGGNAALSAMLTCCDEYVDSGSLKYMVESVNGTESFEAVANGMKVGFFCPTPLYTKKDSIAIAFVTGFGIATRQTTEGMERGMAWFALTIWDCKSKEHADKLRIVILSDTMHCLNHDSGIIC